MVATLTRKAYLTPHYVRTWLQVPDIEPYRNITVGVNNKILVPPQGVEAIHFPSYDFAKHAWIHPPKEVAPSIRTYTHRGLEVERRELIVDFVAHGDEGPASRWAINAEPGAQLGVLMKPDPKQLVPPAAWYLLAGDATAIPVLGAILEALPATAKATVVIEVHGPEDEQVLQSAAQVDLRWLHNPDPQAGSTLAEVVRGIALPTEDRFAYVATEFSSVRAIRSYLRKEQGWSIDELYAFSYWKAGVAEDASAADRQAEKHAV